jgi:CheY-like chemotaxis protein
MSDGLAQEGYTVDWVRDGSAVETAIAAQSYAAVLLDLGLPRRDGVEVLRRMRERRNDVPVIVITARDAIADRVRGPEPGRRDARGLVQSAQRRGVWAPAFLTSSRVRRRCILRSPQSMRSTYSGCT